LFFSKQFYGQADKIDSLKKALELLYRDKGKRGTLSDTNKLKVLNDLAQKLNAKRELKRL